jgi:hypothetical protein
MPERASVFQQVQIGVESVHGTAPGGGANRLLSSMDLMPTPSIGVDTYRPQGNKFPTVAVAGKDLTTYRVTGKPTYTELIYPLSSLLGAATITGPNGDGAYTYTWNPSSTGPDAFVSYDVQRGSSVGAEQSLFTIFTQLGMTFDRDRADLSGAALGRAQTTGVTLTSSPTAIAMVPISPKDISVFADATSAGLGTTRLTRLLRGNWQFGQSKYNPLWTVDSTATSFADIVESTPGATFTALFEADTTGTGFLANVRAGDTRFVRIRAVGPLIAGASSYQFTIDMAAKFGTPSEYRDESGVYALELPWTLVHDATWTRAMQAVLITTVATL